MALRRITPCDYLNIDGEYYCPYVDNSGNVDCDYYCHDDEPEDRSMEEEIIYETCKFDYE